MNTTKRNTDPLGRSMDLGVRMLPALAVALTILGSAWPSWAGSMRASLDRPPLGFLPSHRGDRFPRSA